MFFWDLSRRQNLTYTVYETFKTFKLLSWNTLLFLFFSGRALVKPAYELVTSNEDYERLAQARNRTTYDAASFCVEGEFYKFIISLFLNKFITS